MTATQRILPRISKLKLLVSLKDMFLLFNYFAILSLKIVPEGLNWGNKPGEDDRNHSFLLSSLGHNPMILE